MIRSFQVDADGSVSVVEEKPAAPTRQSKLPEIIANLKSGNYSRAEVSRLIAIELAAVAMDIPYCKNEAEIKACARQRRALCALSDSIFKNGARVQRDELNFDGPKYQCADRINLQWIKQAAEAALGEGNEAIVDQIMKCLEEIRTAGMPELRRLIGTIGLSTGTDSSQSDNGNKGSDPSK